jgi:hypothetical protein
VRKVNSVCEKSKFSQICNKMDGQINSGNIIVAIAIALIVVFMVYNLGKERSNRPDPFGGTDDVHFPVARTYGMVPSTVAESARSASLKAGGGGKLYGAARSGADIKQTLTGAQSSEDPHIRPTHTEAKDNPLLRHQRRATGGNVPTVQGDPIRTPTYVGPSVAGYRLWSSNMPWVPAYNIVTDPDFASKMAQTESTQETKAGRAQAGGIGVDTYKSPYEYEIGTRGPGGPDSLGPGSGPFPGMPMGIPVPRGSLKKTSEKYGYPFYKVSRPLKPYDYFKPFGPNQNVDQEASYADTPFYDRSPNSMYSNGFVGSDIPFISSVSAFAPFPEVDSAWEKTGMLTSKDSEKKELLTLYRKPIAPLQDLFKYSAQDKNGFIIPLSENYLEDGDVVPDVIGKDGRWDVHVFTKDKYVWV